MPFDDVRLDRNTLHKALALCSFKVVFLGRKKLCSAVQTDQEVGRRITNARELRGLSADALASAIGRDIRWLKEIEAGRRRLPMKAATLICYCLRVDPRMLLQGLSYGAEGLDRASRHVKLLQNVERAVRTGIDGNR